MSEENIIKISHISKKYNLYTRPQDRFLEVIGVGKGKLHTEFYALNDISFEVKRGETVGIIGTNGSGKSTLLKIITGVLKQTQGEVSVGGKVSALLELGAGFNQESTGMENIFLNGRMMGYNRKEMEQKVQEIVEFADIGDFINQPVKTYSSGMFARLAFAVAINVEPDILIVDEALSVGDLFFQNKCFHKFEELKEKGVTILFVSHDIASVRQMCSRVLWIERGVQKVFDQSDLVCDMYMDMKRQNMNEMQEDKLGHSITEHITLRPVEEKITFPAISWKESNIISDKVDMKSVFLTDEKGKRVYYMTVDEDYAYHILFSTKEDMDSVIVGIAVENNKGIPLYDFNNFINTGKVIRAEKGRLIEVIFSFRLPRIMKGTYIVSAAFAKGTQSEHIMLTWLHGVTQVEVINPGFNSSYIEIPAKVECSTYEWENVEFV